MTSLTNFYRDLPVLEHFTEVTDSSRHHDVPSDWYIVITDVIGSTRAIANGRYKDVNMVGAACIAALVNTDRKVEIPFIFGGDGATFAIPPELCEPVKRSLAGARQMAREAFQLELRVGIVPVVDLVKTGAWVKIGKYRMSPHIFQPAFSGRGWELAEKLTKDPIAGSLYQLPLDAEVGDADFTGLECRWKGIPPIQDRKLALLVLSLDRDASAHTQIYQKVLQKIESTLGSLEAAKPVRLDLLELNGDPAAFRSEASVRVWRKSGAVMKIVRLMQRWLWQTRTAVLCRIGSRLMKKRIDTESVKWSNYLQDFVQNTDFRKFDGMLRMVIDASLAQIKDIDEFLSELARDRRIAYGMHASPQAIVTCLISSYNGYHTHFVDGSDGGYALAAVQLKKMLSEAGKSKN